MFRKTKIIATVGPASSSPHVIGGMIDAGMDIARLNFSHGDHTSHKKALEIIRSAERSFGKPIGVLADMCGPKIRTGKFQNGKPFELKEGDNVTFAPEKMAKAGEIPITYPGLAKDLRSGDKILLDDGNISIHIESTSGHNIHGVVIDGGTLKEHKGINLPGISVSTSALTKKDIDDMRFALAAKVDYIGLSFVQRPSDIKHARQIMRKAGRIVPVIAKIERQTAVQNIDAIMAEADATMVARGDLGVETPIEEVPILQKNIIALGLKYKRPVIVATQMLESMIEHPRPTRAEVSDVAHAVFDGADAVMLSGETAVGSDPINAVRTMANIIEASEKSPYLPHGEYEPDDADDTIAMATTRAACFAAEEARAKIICVFTMTGKSALYVSKQRPQTNIIAATDTEATARKLALYWGIRTVKIPKWRSIDGMIDNGISALKSAKLISNGDKVVIVCGTAPIVGATNMMKVYQV